MISKNRLNILSSAPPLETAQQRPLPPRLTRRKEREARFERLWLLNPQHFNPNRRCLQKEQCERTWSLLADYVPLKDKKAVDLGCGFGALTRLMGEAGAEVDAVDIATNALKQLEKEHLPRIRCIQDALPNTILPDDHYDVVVCSDLIAEMAPEEHRLFFSELSRLLKREGTLLCSSPIDIYTEEAVQKLFSIAQTEFDITHIRYSYFALYLRLKWWLQTPQQFVVGWEDSSFRQKQLAERRGFSHFWFWMNTTTALIGVWFVLSFLLSPLVYLFKHNRTLLLGLEKIARFFGDENQISHVIFLAHKRPLELTENWVVPVEKPKKREIWE